MQTIRVAAVSMNSEFDKSDQMWATLTGFCEQAAAEGAELVLFPELIVHGHCTPNTWELAETVPDGPATRRVVELAARLGLVLSVGLSEKEHDIVYNTQVLAGPEGYIGKQRKIHLSRDENLFYKGGRELNVFDIGKARIGMVICYDNQFPEVARVLALKGVEVILMPHAAREGLWHDADSEAAARQHVFESFTRSYPMRAIENACFCVFADQAGHAGLVENYPPDHQNQPNHPGGALIFGPNGDLLAHTQTERIRDEMIVHDLDASLLSCARSHPNYTLRVRRPELFGDLVCGQVSS